MLLAIVQPITHRPPDDEKNLGQAIRQIESAAAAGAEVITFPETYPGPWRMPATFDPLPAMCEVARRCGVYVQFGTIKPVPGSQTAAHNLLVLVASNGDVAGVYRRTHPPGPWIYKGGKYWDFEYVAGDEFPVLETRFGDFGMAMCSEVYMPEVSRALALRGAELIFMPAGTEKNLLWDSWRHLIWARAIENLAIVVTTQNLFDASDRGLAMVATPEEIVFESHVAGTFIVEIDLSRIRQLRAARDEAGSSLHMRAKAGVLSQWQRPELDSVLRSRERTGR